MSVLTILAGTLLYTWVKSRETPLAPSAKEQPADAHHPMKNLHSTRSSNHLLEPGDDLSDEERSISDRSEIFSTGAHDTDDEDDDFKPKAKGSA